MSRSPLKYLPLFAAVFATTPLAIDLYLPAMPAMAEQMNAPIADIQLTLSIYLAGYAVGMLLFGPLVDRYGRKPFLLTGLIGFTVLSIALSFTFNAEHFIYLRFLQALFGGAATVTVPGTIRDIFKENTAKGLAYVSMAMMIAPMIAPAIGSVILIFDDWPTIFVALGLYSFLLLIVVIKYFPFIKKDKPTDKFRLPMIISNYKIIFSRLQCYPFLITSMLTTVTFFSYITSISFVYISLYDVSEQMFGLLFAANVMALMTGNFINAKLVGRFSSIQILRACLPGALISAATVAVTLWFMLPISLLIVSLIVLMMHLMIISTNSDALILMSFPHHVGTATATIGTLKFGGGALAGLMLAWLYDSTAKPFAIAVMLFVGILITTQVVSWLLRLPIPQYTEE